MASAGKGWDVALEAQNELRASFHTQAGATFMHGFTEQLTKPGKMFNVLDGELHMAGSDFASADNSVQGAVATVEHGDPMWVSADVVELIEFAAETFRAEAIMPDHLLTEKAFAYLERPLITIDLHGRRCAFRAMSWMLCQYGGNPGARGVVIALWSHMADEDDYREKFGVGLIGGSALSLMHIGHIPFGNEAVLKDTGHHSLACQMQVMWRLGKQEILVPGRERVSRPVWRRRSNWRQIKEVAVLRLRRAKRPKYEGDEREVEWTHRWWVSGHWRNQWYPSLQQHCQIWIDGHIKGPDDRPFIPKRRAIEFTR